MEELGSGSCGIKKQCGHITTWWHCWLVLFSHHFHSSIQRTMRHDQWNIIILIILGNGQEFSEITVEIDIFLNRSSQNEEVLQGQFYFLPPAYVLHFCLEGLSWRHGSNIHPHPPVHPTVGWCMVLPTWSNVFSIWEPFCVDVGN